MVARFLALRYLRGPSGQQGERFLRAVLFIAVGGVALGVAALVLALAIVRGFRGEIEQKIIGFGAHIQVENLQDAPILPDAPGFEADSAATGVGTLEDPVTSSGGNDGVAETLAAVPGVTHVAPAVLDFILLRRSERQTEGVSIWGVEVRPPYLVRSVTDGAFTFAPDAEGRPGVVVGKGLARQLGLKVGDQAVGITLPSPGKMGLGEASRFKALHVAGIYETALADFDDVYVFADIAAARDLLGLPDGAVSRYDLTLANVQDAPQTVTLVQKTLPTNLQARSIYDIYGSLFAWVRLQQSIVPVVISVIVIVAAFNIVGVLLMFGLEKAPDVGILASMGASGKTIRGVFLRLGLAIGLVGTVIGAVLAVAFAAVQQRFGVIRLPAEAYFLDRAPVDVEPLDLLIVAAVTVALCVVAAWLPARFASKTDPLRVLRFR